MTLVLAFAVVLGLLVMGAGVFSLRERGGHKHRVDEVALERWLAEKGYEPDDPDRTLGRGVRRSYRGKSSDRPAVFSDCGDECRLRLELPGPPRPLEIEVRAKWDGHEDARGGRTTVTIPVPPYIQLWGSADASDAGVLGRMLSPQAVRRLADAGEGIFVVFKTDGLVVGERHPLTVECATRTETLAADVLQMWGPIVRELSRASAA
jgi:hypothetical protein